MQTLSKSCTMFLLLTWNMILQVDMTTNCYFSTHKNISVCLTNVHSIMKLSHRKRISLTVFFPMFPFDPPENIRKH